MAIAVIRSNDAHSRCADGARRRKDDYDANATFDGETQRCFLASGPGVSAGAALAMPREYFLGV
jgi:hypothetical protein